MPLNKPVRGQTEWDETLNTALEYLDNKIGPEGPRGTAGVDGSNVLPTDTAIANAIDTTGSATAGALTAKIETEQVGLSFAPPTSVTDTAVGSNPVPIDSIGGFLYGASGNVIYRAATEAGPWTTVATLPAGGTINGLREAGDGEVLASRTASGIWRSSGWATNPLAAAWSQVLATNEQVAPFTWDVAPGAGWVTVTCYTAAGDMSLSRYVWLSKNYGATWTQIFDLAAQHPTLAMATSHMHHAVMDPLWNPTTPRIWLSYHKTPDDPTEAANKLQRQIYSDDSGATWTVFSSEADSDHHPVIGIAAPNGMIFDSDTSPVGLFLVPRTSNPANMVVSTRKLLYQVRRSIAMHGWAARATRGTNGAIHVGFRSSVANYPGYVLSTDGVRTEETITIPPASAADTVDFLNLMFHKGRLLGVFIQTVTGAGARRVVSSPEPRRGAVASSDPGGLRGAVSDALSSAAGLGAVAMAKAVAQGVLSVAAERSVAFGYLAKALTSLSTTIGDESEAAEQATNAGALGKATGYQSINVGTAGEASAAGAINIGRNGKATHAAAINIGLSGSTTATSQLQIGDRHIESKLTATPGAPAANSVRDFIRNVTVNGVSKTQRAIRLATGAIIPLATEGAATPGCVRTGTSSMVAGTITVSDAGITGTSIIRVTHSTTAGTPGALFISARDVGTSFTISSTSNTDTSVVFWEIVAY